MSQKFRANIQQRDNICFVKLFGVIDEDNELAELGDKIGAGTTVIDLGEVERINSCGVRDWVNWLSSIENKGASIVMVECSPSIVAQINLVNNFTGNGMVKSFFIPYFCPECDEEKVLLSEVSDMGEPPYEPPVCRCDDCELVMDFDDMPDSYFAFLASQKSKDAPPELDKALEDYQANSDEPSRIRSRVELSKGGSSKSSGSSLPSVPSMPKLSGKSSPSALSSKNGEGLLSNKNVVYALGGVLGAIVLVLVYLLVS